MITPTEDGVIIDCGGLYQTWGCGCDRCLPREHPLDRGARFTCDQLRRWKQESEAIGYAITRRCITCQGGARLYAGGWFCDEHSPGQTCIIATAGGLCS